MRNHALLAGCLVSFVAFLVSACGGAVPADPTHLISGARQAWASDWHAVWQIEWANAPVRGPLVAEMWHAAGGRLRIETLEAPTAALNGLTLVDDGRQAWLYDLRLNQAREGARERVRIPLANDMVEAIDWLLAQTETATITSAWNDNLESGATTRLEITTAAGEHATLWVNTRTGLVAGFALSSASWGDVKCVTRSLELPTALPVGLFTFRPPVGAETIDN
jgi:outer membrane lipoprotein-sorting protein